MIEQLHLCGERQMQYGEKRAKRAMEKFSLKTILKFYPKIEPSVPGYSSSEYPGNKVALTAHAYKSGYHYCMCASRLLFL